MEQHRVVSRPRTGRTGRATPSRRRHRSRFRARSYPVIVLVSTVAAAGSGYAYLSAPGAGPSVPVAPNVLRQVATVICLIVAVLSQGAGLRAAGRATSAVLVPALVVFVPILFEASAIGHDVLTGVPPHSGALWPVLANPSMAAGLVLVAADGVRALLSWRILVASALVAACLATARALWPVLLEPVLDREAATVQSVVVGMTVCSALIASSHLPTASRWRRALGCALPAILLALLPTLLTAPATLAPSQRWTIVVYPLGCLAAACVAVLFVGSGEVVGRWRTRSVAV